MSEEIKEYDERGNLIYFKHINGLRFWYKYDKHNRLVYCKNIFGKQFWYKYMNNKQIEISKQEFEKIKREREFLSREKINPFELLDIE